MREYREIEISIGQTGIGGTVITAKKLQISIIAYRTATEALTIKSERERKGYCRQLLVAMIADIYGAWDNSCTGRRRDDVIRSARIKSEGSRVCSATIVQNNRQGGRPATNKGRRSA